MLVIFVKRFQANVGAAGIGDFWLGGGVKIIQDGFRGFFACVKELIMPIVQQALGRFAVFGIVDKSTGSLAPVEKFGHVGPKICFILGILVFASLF